MAPLPRSQQPVRRSGVPLNGNAVPLTVKGLRISWFAAAACYVLFGVLPMVFQLFTLTYAGFGQFAPILVLGMELIFAIAACIIALAIARRAAWAWSANVYAAIIIAVLTLTLPVLTFLTGIATFLITCAVSLLASFYILLFSFRYPQTRRYLTARQVWLRRTIEQR